MPDEFKKMAFLTHVPAYVDANLADVDIDDMIRIATGPTLNEWTDPDTRQQAYDALVIVKGDWIERVISYINEQKEYIAKTYLNTQEALNKFNNLLDNIVRLTKTFGDNVEKILDALKGLKRFNIW